MKKFIYSCIPFVLVVVFITILDACTSAVPKNSVSIITADNNESIVVKRYPGQVIRKLEFEGHYYLVVNGGGICHDENCNCKK